MEIEFDDEKRLWTLENRGLDFKDAEAVFDTPHITIKDDRRDYEEARSITFGLMVGRLVAVVWTTRNANRRIISLRKANDREQKRYGPFVG